MSTHDMVAVLFVVFIIIPAIEPIVESVFSVAFDAIESFFPPPPPPPQTPISIQALPVRSISSFTKGRCLGCGFTTDHIIQNGVKRCVDCYADPDDWGAAMRRKN